MLRQQAFEIKRKMLKGGLHCHTTRSDGQLSPEQVLKIYYDNGYDFTSLTDHRKYNYKNFAPEIPITIIPGMEFDSKFEGDKGFRCFHSVCIGPSREDGNGFEQDEVLKSGVSTCQEEYQPYLDMIHQKNNLTIYCHPEWSSTPARYFEKLEGNFAMEIWNSGCAIWNHMDTDAAYWDELLGQGIKIYGVAADDAHDPLPFAKGWVMVNAENNVNSILSALKNGEFYSSCGPEIYDFYVDDGRIYIECSEAVTIRIHSDKHPTKVFNFNEGRTSFDCSADSYGGYKYVRAVVIDKDGKYAWTNPIFMEE